MKNYEDKNIKKVQSLLKLGYTITEIEIEIHKEDATKISLSFAKGNEKKNIIFEDCSEEFFRYINHFHYIYDKNFRKKLTFMPPNEYWGRCEPPGRCEKGKICISGYEFKEFELYPFTRKINSPAILTFDIRTDIDENKDFFMIDYRDRLELFIEEHRLFSGFISAVSSGPLQKSLRVICRDLPPDLDTQTLSGKTGFQKGNHSDLVALICDMTDLNYTSESIKGVHLENRPFRILIPINGFMITDSLKLGQCRIVPKIPEIPFLKDIPICQEETACAEIQLTRDRLYYALIDGIKYIQAAVNLINFRLKMPTFLEGYNFFDQKSGVKLGNFIYCLDLNYYSQIMFHLPLSNPSTFKKGVLIQNFFKPIENLAEKYVNPIRKLSSREEKDFWILHYLNVAEVNPNQIAAFLDLWLALDFVLSRFYRKPIERFKANEIDEIRSYIEEYKTKKEKELREMSNLNKILDKQIEEKIKRYEIAQDRMLQLITKINEQSHIEQLKAILERNKISLSKREWELYKKARSKRNTIIHGKHISKVEKGEYNIVSKLIYFILKTTFLE